MKFFILAALATVALAAEVYPETKYEPTPAYSQPAYKTYEKAYEYPPQPYNFDYAVKDDYTYANFAQNEYSDGKVVSGSYRVALPDGRIQTVTYKDEGYGLIADVKYEGTAQYPEYKPTYKAATYEQPKPAYIQPKVEYKPEAYEQPKVVYTQPKVEYKPQVYEQPKYVAQPAYSPAYQPAPAAYKAAPISYTTTAAPYTTSAPYTTTEYPTTVKY